MYEASGKAGKGNPDQVDQAQTLNKNAKFDIGETKREHLKQKEGRHYTKSEVAHQSCNTYGAEVVRIERKECKTEIRKA